MLSLYNLIRLWNNYRGNHKTTLGVGNLAFLTPERDLSIWFSYVLLNNIRLVIKFKFGFLELGWVETSKISHWAMESQVGFYRRQVLQETLQGRRGTFVGFLRLICDLEEKMRESYYTRLVSNSDTNHQVENIFIITKQ